MTDEEVEAVALSNPDAQPLTEELNQFKRTLFAFSVPLRCVFGKEQS